MTKGDDRKKEIHLDLKTILELDTPQLEPSNNKLELNGNDMLELDSNNKLELEGHSRIDRNSEIELKQALDILKSLKPNNELIKAIKLIEDVLKREKVL